MPHPNPIQLDANGSAVIFMDGSYKLVLTDSNGVVQWTLDNVPGTDEASVIQTSLGDMAQTGFVLSGCIHPTSGIPSVSIPNCRGWTLDPGPPRVLESVNDPTARTVQYGPDGTYWLILHAASSGTLLGWTRSPASSHYLWQQASAQPLLPPRATWLAKVTLSGGQITTVIDLRASNAVSPALLRVTDPLWGAVPNDGLNDTAAFQAVAVAARRGQVLIDVPPGAYYVDGDANDPPGTQTSITLTGVSNVQVRGYGASLMQGPTSIRVLGIYNSTKVKVEGLQCFGHTQTVSQQKHCIAIGHNSSDIEIAHTYLTNFLGDGINVGGNFANGLLTGYTSQHVTIHDNTIKTRIGDNVSSVSGGTRSRLALAMEDCRYCRVERNLIYGEVDLEPNVDGQYLYHISVSDNQFHSGPVSAQSVIGTAYNYDETVVVPGGVGINIPGGIFVTGVAGTPIVQSVTLARNTFERGTITCISTPYQCDIVGNSFHEGLIQVSATSGTGNVDFARVEGNSTRFPYPGETTFIKLKGGVTFGSFVSNGAAIAGGYVIAQEAGVNADQGRNVFLQNVNRSPTAAGALNFVPLATSVAGHNWYNEGSASAALQSQRVLFTDAALFSTRNVAVQTDCVLNVGEYICDYRVLAANNWQTTGSAAATIKQISNIPIGAQLTICNSGAQLITLKHSDEIRLVGNVDFAMNSVEDCVMVRGLATTNGGQVTQIAGTVNE